MATFASWVKTLAENPIWAFSWTVFTVSAGFIGQQAYTSPERVASFQRKSTEVSNLYGELQRAQVIVTLWSSILSGLQESTARHDKEFSSQKHTDKEVTAEVVETRRRYAAMRDVLSTPMAVLNNTAFEHQDLQDLRGRLLADLTTMDALAEKRVKLMSAVLADRRKAQSIAEGMMSDPLEQRALLEASSRGLLIDRVMAAANTRFNDARAEQEVQARLSRIDGYGVKAAAFYIGVFISVVMRKLRRDRRADASGRATKREGSPAAR
jgi:hypothetical protein